MAAIPIAMGAFDREARSEATGEDATGMVASAAGRFVTVATGCGTAGGATAGGAVGAAATGAAGDEGRERFIGTVTASATSTFGGRARAVAADAMDAASTVSSAATNSPAF